MGVYKDKRINKWYFNFKYKDNNGIWRNIKKRGFKTKNEAKEEEAKTKIAVRSNPTNRNIRVKTLCKEYLSIKKGIIKSSSYRDLECIFYNHIIPEFGNFILKDIKLIHLEKWKQKKINEQKYSVSFLNNMRKKLSAIFNFAIKHDMATKNIVKDLEPFKDNSIKKEISFYTYDEFKTFISFFNNDFTNPYYIFFNMLYYTGARQGEVLALTINDIDTKTDTLRINKTCNSKITGVPYLITSPKTKSSVRKVKMPLNLTKVLYPYIKHIKEIEDFNYDMFLLYLDKPLAPSTIQRYRNLACKETHSKKIRIHDFRHSHASLLINNGANPTLVAKRLGHSDIKMTLNTYSHLFHEVEEETIKMIDSLE